MLIQDLTKKVRLKLKNGKPAIGCWIQISNSTTAEIIGDSGYDWVAVDLEHGLINITDLADIFRSLKLNHTLPLARIAFNSEKDCKHALEAGAAGIIVPMINTAKDLKKTLEFSRWPPSGKRGVGFSVANTFGKYFKQYNKFSQNPFIIAMIENVDALDNIDEILSVKGLDGILIGPYDLSASMKITGQFKNRKFKDALKLILEKSKKNAIPCGMHQVDPDKKLLRKLIKDGFTFIPYSTDTVFLRKFSQNPIKT